MSKYITKKWNVLVPVGVGRAIINLLRRNEGLTLLSSVPINKQNQKQ